MNELIFQNKRKKGINEGKNGSVRVVNGKIILDFTYLNERVRVPSGMEYSENNINICRCQLDQIMQLIAENKLHFAIVFPKSKKKEYFTELELKILKRKPLPSELKFVDFSMKWLDEELANDRIKPATYYTYSRYLKTYLNPYFGEQPFSDIDCDKLNMFVTAEKEKKLRGKKISNNSMNKIISLLKRICNSADATYKWGPSFNPFHGWKKLPKEDPYNAIDPFSAEEKKKIIKNLPQHWQPFFEIAFRTGISQNEQLAIKPSDIIWEEKKLRILRAITKDKNGMRIEGSTKNTYRKRTIQLSDEDLSFFKKQMEIQRTMNSTYLFCTEDGDLIDPSKLLKNIWKPALKAAGVDYRPMKQTRHTFSTSNMDRRKSPLKIAKFMGHRNAEMVIKTYSKYKDKNDGVSID